MKAISGTLIYYHFVCKRKLWFYLNDLAMEKYNEDVIIGKLIDENTYTREKKNIMINNEISIDFINNKKIIHEIKKSKSIEEASIYQVKYYLYVLKQMNFDVEKGVIDYPLIKRKENIYLDEDDTLEIEKIIENIKFIGLQKTNSFPYLKKGFCKKCSYYDLCVI